MLRLDQVKHGVQDGGEAGVDGVTVELFTQDGSIVDSAVTSGGGLYTVRNIRPGEPHYLRFVLPPGLLFTQTDRGGDDALDSDVVDSDADGAGRTALFTLSAGAVDQGRDAGLAAPASDSGVRFNDRDGDPGVAWVTPTG